jgi:hypothetical protein
MGDQWTITQDGHVGDLARWFRAIEEFVAEAPNGQGMVRHLLRGAKLDTINEPP